MPSTTPAAIDITTLVSKSGPYRTEYKQDGPRHQAVFTTQAERQTKPLTAHQLLRQHHATNHPFLQTTGQHKVIGNERQRSGDYADIKTK